jgi:hypothetical protein
MIELGDHTPLRAKESPDAIKSTAVGATFRELKIRRQEPSA